MIPNSRQSLLIFPLIIISLFLSFDAFAAGVELYWSSQSSLSLEYDDNINLTNENTEDDIITLINETVNIGIKSEDFDSSIDLSIGYAFYQENDDNNSFRGNLNLSNFKQYPIADNVILDLDGSMSLTDDPVELDELVASDRRSRNRYFRNNSTARVTYQFGEEETMFLGYSTNMLANEDPDIEDSRESRPFFGLNYWFDLYHGFTMRAAYARASFDVSSDYDEYVSSASYIWRLKETTSANLSYARTSQDFEDEGEEDHRFQNLTLGLSHQFDDSLSASVSAGMYRQNFDGADEDGGLSWSATVNKELEDFILSANGGYFQQNPDSFRLEREFSGSINVSRQYEYSAISFTGSRSFREQFFEAENLGFTKEESLSGNYSIQPLEDLNIDVSASYRRNRYVELEFPRKDNVWQIGTSLSYRIFEWLTASLSLSHRERDSNAADERYKANRVFFSLTYPYEGRPVEF
ncbi:MAG: outer membrane beta-barrel protein [Deltaproteobacteria bacterium]|nr:outer membrane beta-barrel protein [Deltaproteobacteria bacterium]